MLTFFAVCPRAIVQVSNSSRWFSAFHFSLYARLKISDKEISVISRKGIRVNSKAMISARTEKEDLEDTFKGKLKVLKEIFTRVH